MLSISCNLDYTESIILRMVSHIFRKSYNKLMINYITYSLNIRLVFFRIMRESMWKEKIRLFWRIKLKKLGRNRLVLRNNCRKLRLVFILCLNNHHLHLQGPYLSDKHGSQDLNHNHKSVSHSKKHLIQPYYYYFNYV